MKLQSLVVAAWLVVSCAGYKVLVTFTTPSRSHGMLARGIVDPLLRAGHEVTWVTPYNDWKPEKNLKFIFVETQPLTAGVDMSVRRNEGIAFVREFATNISEIVASTPAFRDALANEQFDAVVSEWFFSDTDAGYAAVQQVPWILVSGMTQNPHLDGLVDDVRSVSTIPLIMNDYPVPMTFFQRVVNTFMYTMMQIDTWRHLPAQEAFYERQFGPLAAARGVSLPPLRDAMHNVSVMLVNSHPAVAHAQSLPLNVVYIGGYHIAEKVAPLPKDLQDLLDSSPRGVVYFSMGSVLKSSLLLGDMRRDILRVLAALPYTVLWKFEEEFEGLPKNVHIRAWLPQASVLAHPNVKLFITHGGMLSTFEAIRYGVPLLAIPVFGDQPSNAARAVRAGYALSVTYSEDLAPGLKDALDQMLGDDKYYKKAKYLSKIFNSRPVPPSKLVSHYIELAIETKGAYHLRSITHLYAWYERWMLDQLALLLALLYALTRVVRSIIGLCSKKKPVPKKQKKN